MPSNTLCFSYIPQYNYKDNFVHLLQVSVVDTKSSNFVIFGIIAGSLTNHILLMELKLFLLMPPYLVTGQNPALSSRKCMGNPQSGIAMTSILYNNGRRDNDQFCNCHKITRFRDFNIVTSSETTIDAETVRLTF
jgi:hypothetical protein